MDRYIKVRQEPTRGMRRKSDGWETSSFVLTLQVLIPFAIMDGCGEVGGWCSDWRSARSAGICMN